MRITVIVEKQIHPEETSYPICLLVTTALLNRGSEPVLHRQAGEKGCAGCGCKAGRAEPHEENGVNLVTANPDMWLASLRYHPTMENRNELLNLC